jgi:H+/Cl- antiporter ClcA
MAIASALAARLYLALHDGVQWSLKSINPLWRAATGGLVVIGLVLISGERSYLGLGVTAEDPNFVTITGSFSEGTTGHDSWIWKTIYTAITLGSGFKGGEVTPLFFIGATLGHSLASLGGVSLAVCAGLGMIGLFAAASRAPLACAVMGAELFGWEALPLTLLCCYGATLLARKKGIYSTRIEPSAQGQRPN